VIRLVIQIELVRYINIIIIIISNNINILSIIIIINKYNK